MKKPHTTLLLLALTCCGGDPIPLGAGSGSPDVGTGADTRNGPPDVAADVPSGADVSQESDADDATAEDVAAAPPAITVGEPLEPVVVPLWTRAVGFLAALPSGVLVHSDGELLRFIEGQELPVHLGILVGDPRAAVWHDPATLIAGTKGVYTLQGATLAKSPVMAALGKTTIVRDMAVTPDGDLWLSTVKGLFRWRDQSLTPVDTGALPSRDALLAWGAWWDGTPALWVAADGALYALVEDGEALQSWTERDLPVTSLAADSEGALWVVSEGSVQHRDPGGVWSQVPLGDEAVGVSSAGATWVLGATTLYRAEGGVIRAAGETKGAAYVAATASSVLLAGSQGLYRVHPGHVVTLAGVSPNETITVPRAVTILPTPAPEVAGVEADVDGAPVDVATDPWRVTLDPASLGDGPHLLTVTVAWEDASAAASVGFTAKAIPLPTWSADIHPLYLDRCDKCHNPAVTKSPLDTYTLWVERIDDILKNVSSGNMPLPPNPPLSAEDVGRIAAWRDAGFPKGSEP